MALPILNIQLTNSIKGLPESGSLEYTYNSFYNLQNSNATEEESLIGLNITSEEAGIEVDKPIQIDTEVSYDDSVNLIITDRVNPPKIVNSRFYQSDTSTYHITDRKGNLDTNIYSKEHFKIEASLVKATRTVITVDFLGIKDGGMLPVGNYTFYFRLADSDGNESDFIAESGKVVCHVGAVNSPQSIRGGQLNEDSGKLIKFRLNNLDLAYDYINIYYTRSTGDGEQEVVQTYKINSKFKITNNNTEISITGYEQHEQISIDDINIQYQTFDSVRTLTTCQNINFAGNISNNYDTFKTLEKLSLLITPSIVYDEEGIGNLSSTYVEQFNESGGEYYNVNNIYYKLGYWDEEIYRFGIVYILNDYTLSPVFNIRGKKSIDVDSSFDSYTAIQNINYGEDYIIEGSDENIKGVFKIDNTIDTSGNMFSGENAPIKPIGIKFNFTNDVFEGVPLDGVKGLKDLTKGCFIVRQKRIPTILAQSVGIGTTAKGGIPVIKANQPGKISDKWFAESFLKINPGGSIPYLTGDFFPIEDSYVNKNALICPEVSLRRHIFNSFFNSSEFVLSPSKYRAVNKMFLSRFNGDNNFVLNGLTRYTGEESRYNITTSLTLIEPGLTLIGNGEYNFSSKAGDEMIAYKHTDPILGDFEDPSSDEYRIPNSQGPASAGGYYKNLWNTTTTKVRGEYNTYIGCSSGSLEPGEYYNIFQKGYDFKNKWREYFQIRYNDASPFFPVSDRIEWINIKQNSITVFRGDCYINTYTQRMHWNFIDPELPTNHKIIDNWTWYKNFKISTKANEIFDEVSGVVVDKQLAVKKLLQLFTFVTSTYPTYSGEVVTGDLPPGRTAAIKEPIDKKYKKYADINGEFGAQKINRPDVNAVQLGHWVTFKVCSNVNLAMRDLDFTRPAEEAIHKQKRGFYPLQAMSKYNALPESSVINNGISKSLGDKYYYEVPDVPFIRTNFSNRIHYSLPLQQSSFTNGNRIFEGRNYQDYTMEYGALVKLVEWYGTIIAVMEHGVLMIPVNERAMMANASGENVYINTENVLPQNPKVLSNMYGSIWEDSIIKTSRFIYGIDTVGKKIWRTNGEAFELISDLKVQKFLNDNIKLLESDKDKTVNVNFVKTHYNAFKQDVSFVFSYNNKYWHLCWNELSGKWVTQYTWFPEFSENINNIFYTFANTSIHKNAENKLFKHGFSGVEEINEEILPTHWYGEQHPFEYEFVVNGVPGVQKIFNNLKIISNLAEPESFFYEVVGEGFDWNGLKETIVKLSDLTFTGTLDNATIPARNVGESDLDYLNRRYLVYLLANPSVKKLPFIEKKSLDVNDLNSFYTKDRGTMETATKTEDLRDITLRQHNKTKEKLVNVYQRGVDLKKWGRVKGNMQYCEDSWDVQIQPISFKYAYIKDGLLAKTSLNEMKIRDKYIKIRVKYSGTQYAIINALRTLFTISYA